MKRFKQEKIIHTEEEITENSSLYILPIDDETFKLIITDDEGNRSVNATLTGNTKFIQLTDAPLTYTGNGGKVVTVKNSEDGLEFSEPLDTTGFVTIDTEQDINSKKTFTEPQVFQNYLLDIDLENDRLTLSPTEFDSRFKDTYIIGKTVLPNLQYTDELEDYYQNRRIAFGSNILKDFKGNVNYNPAHPANDSIVAFGALLGGGFEHGTNLTLVGTGNLESNDVKQFDSVTAVGKGNHSSVNTAVPNDPNRVVYPVSTPGFDIHAAMVCALMIGHENWTKDIYNSVLVSNHTKIWKYIFNSIVIGSENQNFSGIYDGDNMAHLDHDILIGNNLNRTHPKYKPSHNLIIGSQGGYQSGGGFNPEYRPLLEGYMKAGDDPFLRINGRLELRNSGLNEMVKHSENLVEPLNTFGGWTGSQTGGYVANNLNGNLISNFVPTIGKSYYLKAEARQGDWTAGEWRVTFGGFTDINFGNYTVEQLIIPTVGNQTPFTLEAIGGTGKIYVKIYEIDNTSSVDSILNIISDDNGTVVEMRTGSVENNSLMIGKNTGEKQVIISDTVVVGNGALAKTNIGTKNAVFGVNAMGDSPSTVEGSAFGFEALKKAYGQNDAFGAYALTSLLPSDINIRNASFGNHTLRSLINGGGNTSFGNVCLTNLTTGTNNTTIGLYSGNGLFTGSYNTYVGARSFPSSNNVNNEIILGGASTEFSNNIGKGDNTVKVGNEQISKTYIYGELYRNDVKDEEFLTQAQYDALTPAQQNNGTKYFIQA